MELIISDRRFAYEAENICRLFFRQLSVRVGLARQARVYDERIYLRATGRSCGRLVCSVKLDGRQQTVVGRFAQQSGRTMEQELCTMLYDTLCPLTGYRPAWGVLTGIRPASLARRLLVAEGSKQGATLVMQQRYRVLADKADLAMEIAERAIPVIGTSGRNSFSLYISIPFCPSRCSYCSFVSRTVEKDAALVDSYLARLCSDIAALGKTAHELDLRLMTVYVGGGTPGILTACQTHKLMDALKRAFPDTVECTFEAGRPETIDPEKLAVLLRYGVNRISINPQTMQDELLCSIGRRHTVAGIERAFGMARDAGFANINADLIAGLPGDTAVRFGASLERLLLLDPEHVTVHALTLKRSSTLKETGAVWNSEAAGMVNEARRTIVPRGYEPYYLYRQKGTVENLENVGYAKPGYLCRYNIFMMDEVHTVAGIGAAAMTKLVDPSSGRIQRIANLKYPAEYLARPDRMDAIVAGMQAFYNGD